MSKDNHSTFTPNGKPLLIGSLPVADHRTALEWIFESTPEIPLWPQLPANPLEGMLNQFVEGFPCVTEEGNRTYFNLEASAFEEKQLQFYEDYLQVAEHPESLLDSRFRLNRERTGGLYHLADAAAGKKNLTALKGQITGPFTLLTGLKDRNDRLGYYDATVRDMTVKDIAMKAAWQVSFLKNAADLPVLLFFDEPALAGLGSSAFISIAREDIAQDLAEVIDAVHRTKGLAGIHVCANTDWTLLLDSAVDIISFDAYNFFDRFITCRQQILSFFDRGGIIAWGGIPTSEKENILRETPDTLVSLWEKHAGELMDSRWTLPALLGKTLITPSCGTGSLSMDLARRVLTLTRDVSAALRAKYGTGEM
jgi:methionine synthase II (cobalamin-independent)